MTRDDLIAMKRTLATVAAKRVVERDAAIRAERKAKITPMMREYHADLEREQQLADRVEARAVRASMIARTTETRDGQVFDAYQIVDLTDAYDVLAIRRASA